nr:(d)CMP kinase [uncultured Anaeromusa sp.]
MEKKVVIAIDGPAGAGKSTVAKMVAQQLGYVYIDTGAMYRAVAWKATQVGIGAEQHEALANMLKEFHLELLPSEGAAKVIVDGVDVSEAIRRPEISRQVSIYAQQPQVRKALLSMQREMGAAGGVVMDGRDIGTAVFPQAEVKVFLTASLQERAHRRWLELQAKGESIEEAIVAAEMESRDKQDEERELAPLVQAEDAYLLDTSGLGIHDVVAEIAGLCQACRDAGKKV